MEAPSLENHQILQKNEEEIKESLRKDLAKIHGVTPDKVYIRRIVTGSIEVYFSIPE